MKQGFQTTIANVVTSDGRNVKFVDPVDYIAVDGTRHRIPRGATSDGISSPPASWPVRPPFGSSWLAGVLHDCAYQNTLKLVIKNVDGEEVMPANLTKAQADDLLREAALSLGACELEAETLYLGVKEFGWRAFRDDRS